MVKSFPQYTHQNVCFKTLLPRLQNFKEFEYKKVAKKYNTYAVAKRNASSTISLSKNKRRDFVVDSQQKRGIK